MRNALRLGGGELLGLVASTAIVLGTCSNAWAALLAHEGFVYTPDTLIVGLDGGTGWNGAWDETQAASFATATKAGSLTYTDGLGNVLNTTGGKLLVTGVGDGVTSQTSQPGRFLANRRTSPESGTTVSTWISFLGKRIGDTEPSGTYLGTYRRGANLALFDLDTVTPKLVPEKLDLGESSNYQFPLVPGTPGSNFEDRFQSRFVGIPTSILSPQPYAPNPEGSGSSTAAGAQIRDAASNAKFNELGLMVIRIDHVAGDANASTVMTGPGANGGNDNVYIWMNPNLNTTPLDANASIKYVSADIVNFANNLATPAQPYTGGASGAGNGGEIDFNRLRLFAGNVAGTTPFAQWELDELRVGETFADVAPFAPGGVPGDYNKNSVVDAADYVVWREAQLNAATTLDNRGTGITGTVGQADYDFWRSNFGKPPGSSAGGEIGGVPEPHSIALLVLALAALGANRYARRRG